MAVPAAIASFVGGGTMQAIGGGLFQTFGAQLWPSAEALSHYHIQGGYWDHPTTVPPIGAILQAWVSGWGEYARAGSEFNEDYGLLQEFMRKNGVATSVDGVAKDVPIDYDRYNAIWHTCIDSMINRPGVKEAFMGLISGLLKPDEFKKMMRRNGCIDEDWLWLVPFYSQRLNVDEVVDLYRRGSLNDPAMDQYLKILQFGVPGDIAKVKELSNVIPGYQDIIRFAIREAFNPGQIAALGLAKELDQNPDYLDFAKAAGLGPVTITTAKGEKKTVNFAELYWYAHWDLPSPGQSYDFFHKFYGNSRYGKSPYLQYAPEFNLNDLNNVLKANDYSPKFRDHLAGAAFLPYTRIDVRRIRKGGFITKEQVYHNCRASGYDDEHANSMTEWIEKDIADSKNAPVRNGTKTQVCKAYQIGLIDGDAAIAALVGVGFEPQEAKSQHGLCDMTWANDYAKDAVNTIRGGYLTGAFTLQEARTALLAYGIVTKRIDQLLSLWHLKLDARRKQVAAKEISGWFIEGIIGMDDLISRLTKLNYFPVDVTRIVQAAVLEQSKRYNRAQKQAASEAQKIIEKNIRETEKRRKEMAQAARQQQRELEKQRRDADQAASDRLRRFLSGRSESNLRKWLASNEITEQEVSDTFTQRGWNPVDIERWLQIERERNA